MMEITQVITPERGPPSNQDLQPNQNFTTLWNTQNAVWGRMQANYAYTLKTKIVEE